jgi:hypothetical protein
MSAFDPKQTSATNRAILPRGWNRLTADVLAAPVPAAFLPRESV